MPSYGSALQRRNWFYPALGGFALLLHLCGLWHKGLKIGSGGIFQILAIQKRGWTVSLHSLYTVQSSHYFLSKKACIVHTTSTTSIAQLSTTWYTIHSIYVRAQAVWTVMWSRAQTQSSWIVRSYNNNIVQMMLIFLQCGKHATGEKTKLEKQK